MEEKKKPEVEDENNLVPIDMTAVCFSCWEKGQKSLEDRNLRGGDFVLDGDGNVCTIRFHCLRKKVLPKVYSLTAGKLADLGDSLVIFVGSQPDKEG